MLRFPQRHIIRQCLAALVGCQTFLVLGAAVATGGVLFHQETSSSSSHHQQLGLHHRLGVVEATWLVSVFTLSNIPGNLISSLLQHRLGALTLCKLSAPLAILGALMIVCSDFYQPFLVSIIGRMLVGFYFGVTEGPSRAFVGEVSAAEMRGLFTSLLNVSSCVGMLVTFCLGSVCAWRNVEAGIVISACILQLACIMQLQESPHWMASRGRPHHEIVQCVLFYTSSNNNNNKTTTSTDTHARVKAICASINTASCHTQSDPHHHHNLDQDVRHEKKQKIKKITDTCFSVPHYWRAVLFLLLQFTCLVLSGGLAVSQFAPTIFSPSLPAGGESPATYLHLPSQADDGDSDVNMTSFTSRSFLIDMNSNDNATLLMKSMKMSLSIQDSSRTWRITPYLSSVILTAVMLVSMLVSAPLMDRWPRRLILQLSSAGGLIGCCLMSAAFHLQQHHQDHAQLGWWLLLGGAMLVIVSYGGGLLPVSFCLLVEMLSTRVRSFVINMVLLYFSLAQWAVVHHFPLLSSKLGDSCLMLVFAGVNMIQCIMTFSKCLPETSGVPLEHVQQQHSNNNNNNNKHDADNNNKQQQQ